MWYIMCADRDRKEMTLMEGQWNMATVMAVIAIVVILFLAIRYIVREKRKGVHCIGCPMAGSCTKAYKQMEQEMRACIKRDMAEQSTEQ